MAALTGNKALMDEIVLPFAADREAKYIGCWAVTEPDQIRPAVERAIKVIKEEKRPALVDVYIQTV